MPEAIVETQVNLPMQAVWDFVKDMNNWAPFIRGYQSHEIQDDRRSIWRLKGDVGVLSREVSLNVHITEWNGPHRVAFTLDGINESVHGAGNFEMKSASRASEVEMGANKKAPSTLWERFWQWFWKKFLSQSSGAQPPALTGDVSPTQTSTLCFTFQLEAGGPTGPLVNAMLGPMLHPVTEELAQRIVDHLHQSSGQQNDSSSPA